MNIEKIKEIMEKLENISKNNYNEFEIALVLFLRADKHIFNEISLNDLNEINNMINDYDSILDIDKDDIDYILHKGE